VLIAKDLDVTY